MNIKVKIFDIQSNDRSLILSKMNNFLKSYLMISLILISLFQIHVVKSSDENISKKDNIDNVELNSNIVFDKEIHKKKVFKSCESLIKVRLSQDMEIAKNLILNFMDSYQITKEDALTKLNTFLTLSCIYNIIPEQIEEILKIKNPIDIDSMKPDYIKILELEEWLDLHKKYDVTRIKEKMNFLKTHYNKLIDRKTEPKTKSKGLMLLGIDLLNLSLVANICIFVFVFIILICGFAYLFLILNKEKKIKKKK